ncbi:hypothetical protein [Alistipes putredinis]|uniref:hypothetical protein n=1 Tax=Alistipes putredinis TaxID=28117 RepID=UPI0039936033
MEKSKIVMGILAAATLGACQSSKVKISGRLVGADARQVYIEQFSAGGKAPDRFWCRSTTRATTGSN